MKRLITFAWYLSALLAHRIYGISGVCSILRKTGDGWTTEKILRRFGAHVDNNVTFGGFIRIFNAREDFSNLIIDRKAYIGQDVFLDLSGSIVIEEEVVVAMNACILTHQEAGKNRVMDELLPRKQEMVRLRRGSFIGEGSTVLCGVTVGVCSCVGAKSLVNKNIPYYEMWAGVPPRFICRFKSHYKIEDEIENCSTCLYSFKSEGEELCCGHGKAFELAKVERSYGPVRASFSRACGRNGRFYKRRPPYFTVSESLINN